MATYVATDCLIFTASPVTSPSVKFQLKCKLFKCLRADTQLQCVSVRVVCVCQLSLSRREASSPSFETLEVTSGPVCKKNTAAILAETSEIIGEIRTWAKST